MEQGPSLTYRGRIYQGCVRYKRGCKFCIEQKAFQFGAKPEDIIEEVETAHDQGVQNVRPMVRPILMTYMAEGSKELRVSILNPEPIAKLLHGLREDERLDILLIMNLPLLR